MDNEEKAFYTYLFRHFILSDEEIDLLGADNEYYIKFNQYKREVFRRMRPYFPAIISLGETCLPHTFIHSYHLSSTRQLQLPFDLQLTPLDAVASVLESNFDVFRADGAVKYTSFFCYAIRTLNIRFTHAKATRRFCPQEEIDAFNKILAARVNNFRQVVSGGSAMAFMHVSILEQANLECIYRLEEILRAKFGIDNVFWLNSHEYDAPVVPGCDILTIHNPLKDYLWYDVEHVFTQAGFDYERRIVENLCAFIENIYEPDAGARAMPAINGLAYRDAARRHQKNGRAQLAALCAEKARGMGVAP